MSRPARGLTEGGVNLERFRPDRAAGRAFRDGQGLGDGPSVLAVGALEREKRYGWLLTALARLPEPRPRLVVCGDGGLADALRAQAERERLEVRLLGQVTPRELAGASNAATCVGHGCDLETFGISVPEAMAPS